MARILVAEDVEEVALKLTSALASAGYEVDAAVDGEQCLEKVRSFKPDLILLDLIMPKLHGLEVLRTLGADSETRDIGVIICSAKDFATEQKSAAELGAWDYLVKPVDIGDLLEKVSAFLSHGSPDAAPTLTRPPTAQPGEAYRPELETTRGRTALWGTRGSIPTPGAAFMRHGGNTSCMEIEHREHKFIFDAGSGIRELGLELMKGEARDLHLFITHTHWDHIQGFPFFPPAYTPGFRVTVYGAEGFGKSLESVFRGQLDQDYFPVQMDDLNADIQFRHLSEEPLTIGDVTVSWEYAHHPGATVGYKIDVASTTLSWFPDNEFLQGYIGPPDDVSIDDDIVEPYRRMIDFLTDVDVLIHEAQYTNDEYATRVAWGHSSISNACLLARMANVKRWIVTHHDPMHDDRFLETKLDLTRQQLARLGHDIPVLHGHDGMVEYL